MELPRPAGNPPIEDIVKEGPGTVLFERYSRLSFITSFCRCWSACLSVLSDVLSLYSTNHTPLSCCLPCSHKHTLTDTLFPVENCRMISPFTTSSVHVHVYYLSLIQSVGGDRVTTLDFEFEFPISHSLSVLHYKFADH